jgi:hypothetical protein
MMEIDGSCLCGSVSFEARVDPLQVFICHCTDCQTHSGTAFRTIVRAKSGSFELTSGELKVYEKKAESGATRRLAFCPECGTPIYGGPPTGEAGFLSLRIGPIRQRSELHPVAQVWCRSSQSWLDRLGDLPRIETQPSASGGGSPD